jgi:LPS sulfotransferase NodH
VTASRVGACSYVIATNPRSGTNLLCEALTQTGIAGRPAEIGLKFRGDVPFDDYVAARIRAFSTGNGVSGVKLFWGQVQALIRQGYPTLDSDGLLEHLFGDARYVRLIRHDRRGQAVSLYRAMATNEFRRRPGVANRHINGPDPDFNGEEIRRLEKMLIRHEACWDESFRRRGITPLVLEYETLVSERREQTSRVLSFIGQDPAAAFTIPEPQLLRQADSKTVQWCQMLDAEDALADRR